jgi:hypothetical protein
MFGSTLLDKTEHTSRPWRIHAVANDFQILDVWALPTPGDADDFGRLVELWSTFDARRSSPIVRALFAIRWTLGRVLGLDRPDTGLGKRVEMLRDRLPVDLRDAPTDFVDDRSPFTPLYLTDDEFALEIANQTVHGVMHVGWVRDETRESGDFRGQLAVLVRPNGALGVAYLRAIAPFRHLIVYPLMMRDIGRVWRENLSTSTQPDRRHP